MTKIYPYIALVILSGLALIPPIDWFIENPPNDKWLWMICIAGFMGFLTCFVYTSWWVRFIAIFGFLNCFFSAIPYLSFTAYVLLVGCCWFYICCERIEDWTVVLNAMQAVLFLNVFLLMMEACHKDPLLNFGAGSHIDQYAVMGHHMLMGSFAVVIAAFLLPFSRVNIIFPFLVGMFCVSIWSFFAATVGCLILYWSTAKKHLAKISLAGILFVLGFLGWANVEGKFQANLHTTYGRVAIWEKTLAFSIKRPVMGWGIGTYKDLFPALYKYPDYPHLPYRTAHNFILELAFEIGWPLTILILLGIAFLMLKLYQYGLYDNLAGLSMVCIDALIHFPDRMTQCVPIIIALIANSVFCLRKSEAAYIQTRRDR